MGIVLDFTARTVQGFRIPGVVALPDVMIGTDKDASASLIGRLEQGNLLHQWHNRPGDRRAIGDSLLCSGERNDG